jgi:effector-binding domain-containing protein
MQYEFEIKEIEPQPVASIRLKCKAAEVGPIINEILPEIFKYLEGRGVHPCGPPFTCYHGYAGDEVEMESGFPVSEPQPEKGRIKSGELPGGTVAATVHAGPYEDLPKAHDALHEWIQDQGREPAGKQWEYYLTDPGIEPDLNTQRVELLWPVK